MSPLQMLLIVFSIAVLLIPLFVTVLRFIAQHFPALNQSSIDILDIDDKYLIGDIEDND